jgi:hypothetical protein
LYCLPPVLMTAYMRGNSVMISATIAEKLVIIRL